MAALRGMVKRLLSPWAIAFGTRSAGIRQELAFWDGWLASHGGEWPEEFRDRIAQAAPFPQRFHRWIEHFPGPRLDVLDVGSGPLSCLGGVHPRFSIRLQAVDPLANEYNALLARHRIIAPVPALACEAEALLGFFGSTRFDVLHARNCLDHARDPVAAIAAMAAVSRPEAVIILDHESNEGRREGYRGLHRWNFEVRDGRLTVVGAWGRCRGVAEVMPGFTCVQIDGSAGRAFAVFRRG